MATQQLCHRNLRPITSGSSQHLFPSRHSTVKTRQNFKWAVKLSLSTPPKSTVDVERLVGFLYDDLPHLFDDQGIDRTAYDEQVKFRDPITKHDTITGYLFNISLLKILFRPDFFLHWVKQVSFFFYFFFKI